MHYHEFLHHLHRNWSIRRYLEIGTYTGMSLGRAVGEAVAIDPKFKLDKTCWSAKRGINLFEMTSDSFFACYDPTAVLGGPIEFGFIDGLHQAEFVLRDFINIERHCVKDSVIAVHDVLPKNFEMTEREHRPGHRRDRQLGLDWTGDVWRIVSLLGQVRPDIEVRILDCPPTGLMLVGNLDPTSDVLPRSLDRLADSLSDPALEPDFWSFIEQVKVLDSQKLFSVP